MNEPALRLEVGKRYNGERVRCRKIVAKTIDGIYLAVHENMEHTYIPYSENGKPLVLSWSPLTEEYKEPVTHRRDIVWCKNLNTGKILILELDVGDRMGNPYLVELHRQMVEYIEK